MTEREGEGSPESSRQEGVRGIRPKVRLVRGSTISGGGRGPSVSVLAGTAAIAILALLALRLPGAGGSGIPDSIDGLPVLSVSEVLAGRSTATLGGTQVAVGGFWSNAVVRRACSPVPLVGELEIPCYDGQYGITESDEPIFSADRFGQGKPASGPHLTPWIPDGVARRDELFTLPIINGQRFPPVPIVVVGHFDDERAGECATSARKFCSDRLVIDRIAVFDAKSVATPAPSPTPSPFPSPAPEGLFDAKAPRACAGDVEYSFVGWTTTAELGVSPERDGHVWAAVTSDVVLLGGEEWSQDPASMQEFRWWGRLICFAEEGQPGVLVYGAVEGTTYKEWRDGTTTPADIP